MAGDNLLYLDLVIILNVCINSFLLGLTSYIVRQKTTIYRMLAGGLLGASCLLFLYESGEMPFLWGFRLILPFLMIWVVFRPRRLEQFMLLFFVFFLCTFLLGGVMFSLSVLFNQPQQFDRGVYFIASPELVSFFIAGSGLFVLLRFAVYPLLLQRLNVHLPSTAVPMELVFQGKKKSIRAFMDTGNMLKEPFSGLPVAVAKYSAVKDILPREIAEIIKQSPEPDWKKIEHMYDELDCPEAFSWIPFQTIKGNGFMLAFKPEKVSIWKGSKQVFFNRKLFIGIKQENAGIPEEDFEVLLPLELWRLMEMQEC